MNARASVASVDRITLFSLGLCRGVYEIERRYLLRSDQETITGGLNVFCSLAWASSDIRGPNPPSRHSAD